MTLSARGASLLLLAAACGPPPESSEPRLIDLTDASDVEFVHETGFRGPFYFPETVGAGVALVDLDEDGALDLYAVQSGFVPGHLAAAGEDESPVNRLFRGLGDGTFEDVTATSGDAADGRYGMGVCAGDVNGDGRVDLLVTNLGADLLLVNESLSAGTLTFRDDAGAVADERWTTGAGFADLDQDGHLDLVVCAYVEWSVETEHECMSGGVPDYCHVSLYPGLPDRVYRGDGRGGFRDVTAEHDVGERTGRAFGLALVDFDKDGAVDLYVANDSVENHFYLNQDGRLTDTTNLSGAAYNVDGMAEAGMGVAVGDLDGDPLPDLFVTNFAGESNTVYSNRGQGQFRDASRQSGITAVSRPPLGFGTVLLDVDQDGVNDLFVSNGHVLRTAGSPDSPWGFAQPDQLFRGVRGELTTRFEPWEVGAGVLDVPRVGRGAAAGDVDGDGDLDLALLGSGERLVLVRNDATVEGSTFLRVALRANGSNTSAIGSFVTLTLEDGTILRRWVVSGTGFLSQDDLTVTFGIPPGMTARRVRVTWPDGETTGVKVDALGTTLRIVQSDGDRE